MQTKTLSLWGKGAITLPKRWREQFPTKHFLAQMTPKGLLITPILNVEYYEHDNGDFGLRFPAGIEPQELSRLLKEGDSQLRTTKKRRKNSKSSPR
jgi:hypothetical protein